MIFRETSHLKWLLKVQIQKCIQVSVTRPSCPHDLKKEKKTLLQRKSERGSQCYTSLCSDCTVSVNTSSVFISGSSGSTSCLTVTLTEQEVSSPSSSVLTKELSGWSVRSLLGDGVTSMYDWGSRKKVRSAGEGLRIKLLFWRYLHFYNLRNRKDGKSKQRNQTGQMLPE